MDVDKLDLVAEVLGLVVSIVTAILLGLGHDSASTWVSVILGGIVTSALKVYVMVRDGPREE